MRKKAKQTWTWISLPQTRFVTEFLSHYLLFGGWLLHRIGSQKCKYFKTPLNDNRLFYTLSNKQNQFIKRQVVWFLVNWTDARTLCSYSVSIHLGVWDKIHVSSFLLRRVWGGKQCNSEAILSYIKLFVKLNITHHKKQLGFPWGIQDTWILPTPSAENVEYNPIMS